VMAKTLIETKVYAKYWDSNAEVKQLEMGEYNNPLVTLSTGSREEEARLKAALLSGEDVFALLLTKTECGESRWKKYVMECAIGLMSDMMNDMRSNEKPPYNTNESVHDIDLNMLNQLRIIVGVLQYMTNSTSWHTGIYQPYDKQELTKRLEQAIMLGRG
jgi:hypothetical protein